MDLMWENWEEAVQRDSICWEKPARSTTVPFFCVLFSLLNVKLAIWVSSNNRITGLCSEESFLLFQRLVVTQVCVEYKLGFM